MVNFLRVLGFAALVSSSCGFSIQLYAERVIHISSIPTNTPDGEQFTLGSSANSWNPGDPNWVFQSGEGGWYLNVPTAAPNTFQGKVTRGSWATVEANASGGFLPDRNFNFTTSDTISIAIAGWEGQSGVDLPENLILFDNAFFMPQLNRSRRIRVLLPANYDNSTDHYPVLYMHDGQNLFSASESFAGEWEVDEALASFESDGYNGAIVVALDNGGGFRIEEYTPWANPQYGGGEGMEYAAFIASTLKPLIDEGYRTLPDASNTGIMGSSLGGLISHYAGVAYPDVFGKVGVLSPSFWFTDDIYTFTQSMADGNQGRYYFLAGGQESASLQGQVQSMVDLMESAGMSEDQIRYDFVANGQHSEWFWAQEFPTAFEWLFINAPLSTADANTDKTIALYPNPSGDTISLRSGDRNDFEVEIIDLMGRSFGKIQTSNGQLSVVHLCKGVYRLLILDEALNVSKTFIKL